MKRALLALVLLFISSTAQQPPNVDEILDPIYVFEAVTEGLVEVGIGESKTTRVTFYDNSRDHPNSQVPDAAPGIPLSNHRTTIRLIPQTEAQGWLIQSFSGGFTTQGGDQRSFDIQITATPQATAPTYPFEINFTITDQRGVVRYLSQNLAAYTPGLEAFDAQSISAPQFEPDAVGEASIRISNAASLSTREFGFREYSNPCGFSVATDTIAIAAKSSEIVAISMLAPNDQFWYQSKSCIIQLEVFPTTAPNNAKTVTIVATVNGLYVDGDWVVTALWVTAIIALLIFIVAARKARIEEEILGKPQAPWTIPAEKVYLAHLKERDRRSWYIVRHYLMEEEYKSALLWYKAYKRATKGERRRERIIVQHEHVYDRFESKWEKRIQAPIKKADRNERRLQKKVARAMRKEHRKELRAYKKSVKAVEKAHDKKVKKATKKWAKLAKRASKKGAQAPPQPHFDAPVHADPPVASDYEFEDHKLALKEAKFRARMVKKQLKLQAKHAKGEAKLKAKVRKKVQKLAKKLDDPSFIDSLDVLQD